MVALVARGEATPRAAAVRLGIPESTAYYWLKRSTRREASAGLAKAQVKPRPTIAPAFVLNPDGTIARYLQGVQIGPDDLAGALHAAAAGRLSAASIAETVLSCFHYDPAPRAHREAISRYLQIGGGAIRPRRSTAASLT